MTTATAPETPDPDPAASPEPWSRRPSEGARAFEAFQCYLSLGASRSLDKVGLEISPPKITEKGQKRRKRDAGSQIFEWCREHGWVARARAWDDHLAKIENAAKFRALAEQAELWASRRLEMAEDNWLRSRKLAKLADDLLKEPQEKWSTRDIASIAKAAAELAAASIVDGLGGADDGFDVENASPEELRAYLEKNGFKPRGS